jgi:hypothetical protein
VVSAGVALLVLRRACLSSRYERASMDVCMLFLFKSPDWREVSDRLCDVDATWGSHSLTGLAVLEQLSTTIVCFFADGSEEFTAMTTVAMRSFLFHTPRIACGLLTHDRATRDRVMSALPPDALSRVVCKFTSQHGHLDGPWNATKFKLDLIQFATSNAHFTIVVWLDSDTLCFNDMTPFISYFIKQTVR